MKKIKKAFKYIGKKVGKFSYDIAVDIARDDRRKGGFYNLHGDPGIKNKKKVRYVYVYPRKNKYRVKRIKHKKVYSYNDPFKLSF